MSYTELYLVTQLYMLKGKESSTYISAIGSSAWSSGRGRMARPMATPKFGPLPGHGSSESLSSGGPSAPFPSGALPWVRQQARATGIVCVNWHFFSRHTFPGLCFPEGFVSWGLFSVGWNIRYCSILKSGDLESLDITGFVHIPSSSLVIGTLPMVFWKTLPLWLMG